jgi:hypothetical protein
MEFTEREKDLMIGILESLRIDSILNENDLCQDELGMILSKLGSKEYTEVYLGE